MHVVAAPASLEASCAETQGAVLHVADARDSVAARAAHGSHPRSRTAPRYDPRPRAQSVSSAPSTNRAACGAREPNTVSAWLQRVRTGRRIGSLLCWNQSTQTTR